MQNLREGVLSCLRCMLAARQASHDGNTVKSYISLSLADDDTAQMETAQLQKAHSPSLCTALFFQSEPRLTG